jgi:hypothetical protein
MTQIRVDDITDSKSGKSWRVKSGSNWYGASKDLLSLSDKGKVFEAKISASDFGPWIDNATPVGQEKAQGPSTSAPGTLSAAPWWLPMASNVVAHAIQAGEIKTPDQIKVWVAAVRDAAEGSAKGDIGF